MEAEKVQPPLKADAKEKKTTEPNTATKGTSEDHYGPISSRDLKLMEIFSRN